MMLGARRSSAAAAEYVKGPRLVYPVSGSSITYSSQLSTTYAASKAFNGNKGDYIDRWLCGTGHFLKNSNYPYSLLDGHRCDWTLNFGSQKKLYGIELFISAQGPRNIEVYGSTSGSFSGEHVLLGSFNELQNTGSISVPVGTGELIFSNPGEYRYLRVSITVRWGTLANDYAGFNEIEIITYQ